MSLDYPIKNKEGAKYMWEGVLAGCAVGFTTALVVHFLTISREERKEKRELTEKKNKIKQSVLLELKNLLVRLAMTCHTIQNHLGLGNKSTLRWVKTICEKYIEGCSKDLLTTMEKLLQLPDNQFNAEMKLKESKNTGLALKTHALPFTESILEHLLICDLKFQMGVFEVWAQINILNEEIRDADYFHRLTFDSSSMKTNEAAIKSNIISRYNHIQKRNEIIAGKIDKIITEFGEQPATAGRRD